MADTTKARVHAREAVVRAARDATGDWSWTFFHGMTGEHREAFDADLVERKDPLAFEAGTTESRFRAKVAEAKREGIEWAAFGLVADPKDWKAPIGAYCSVDLKDVIHDAVIHFTATRAHFAGPITGGPKRGLFWVTADGYRAGPAGDH
jgi:hypothetical protein